MSGGVSMPVVARRSASALGLTVSGLIPLAVASQLTNQAYTVALLAFVFPTALALADLGAAWRRPLVRALALLVPSGWLLGYAFGGRFFRYPNPHAVLGVGLAAPGDAGPRFVPVEEFLFYLLGFTFMATMYAWWCDRVARPRTPTPPTARRALLLAPPGAALAGVLALPAGRPGYAIFLALVYVLVFLTLALRLGRALRLDALAFATAITLALSFPWEALLAIPRGWWGYEPSHMLGAWAAPGLPVEAVFVWLLGPVGTSLTVQAWVDDAPVPEARWVHRLAEALGWALHPALLFPIGLFAAFHTADPSSAAAWTVAALVCLAPPALAWVIGVRQGRFSGPDLVFREERPALLGAACVSAAIFAGLAAVAGPPGIRDASLGLCVVTGLVTALTTLGLKVSLHVATSAVFAAVLAGRSEGALPFALAALALSWARVRAGVHRPVEVAGAWVLAALALVLR